MAVPEKADREAGPRRSRADSFLKTAPAPATVLKDEVFRYVTGIKLGRQRRRMNLSQETCCHERMHKMHTDHILSEGKNMKQKKLVKTVILVLSAA